MFFFAFFLGGYSKNKSKQKKTAKNKRKTCENKAKKSEKKRQIRTATFFCFFVCFDFCFCFAFCLLYKTILAPCIYGWRARHKTTLHYFGISIGHPFVDPLCCFLLPEKVGRWTPKMPHPKDLINKNACRDQVVGSRELREACRLRDFRPVNSVP